MTIKKRVEKVAKALGIDPAKFINTLITIVHLFFGMIAFTTFIVTMIGIFKTSMAKKEDRIAKKKGAMMALMAGVMLIFTIFLWAGAYYYLSQKVINTEPEALLPPVITTPEKVTELTAPITIEFDASYAPINRQKHEIISYEWDFGDGDKGTGVKVSHTYKDKGENQGRFSVKLEVHKLDKKTAEEIVDVYKDIIVSIANEKVSAEFEATPEIGEAPLKVSFDASATKDPDGEVMRYDWDFDGDESFDDAEGVKVTHTFDKIGEYEVQLRATDNSGQYSIGKKTILIKEATNPIAKIELETETDEYLTGETYIFSAAKSFSPGGAIEKYEWDFGDGSPKANTKTVSHVFKTSGKFEVTLIITDEEKSTGETYLEVKVNSPTEAPKAVLKTTPEKGEDSPYLEGEVPFEVIFEAGDSTDADDNIVDFEWDFNGDTVTDALGVTQDHIFTETGTYNVILKVTDADGNVSQDSITVKAREQGIKALLKATPITGPTPLTVTFDASGSSYPDGEIISYEWDFGDGSNKQLGDSKISHKYKSVGQFDATVTAIASDNERAEKVVTVTVTPVGLQACFTSSKSQGEAPLIVVFDGSCSEGTITKFLWNFGDEGTSVSNKPTHTFQEPGTYTVTLEVSDNENTVDIFEDTIVVTGEIAE